MGCLCCCCMARDPSSDGEDQFLNVSSEQWPIVYSPEYNIGFCGLENLHPFDSKKWGRVFGLLESGGMISRATAVEPHEIQTRELLKVHTPRYLNSLKSSCTVAMILGVPPVACLCPCIIDRHVLRPFRYHTAGTILAGRLAIERGWAINIGGGFHHCSSDHGGGFCTYADITLAIRFLFDNVPTVKRAMIIDLDAHQGNGHERDFLNDERVFIMDVYNSGIYPGDTEAKRAIRCNVPLQHLTEDETYMPLLRKNMEKSLSEFRPDIVVYNAGTDILDGDSLGLLSISEHGIVVRDELVFSTVRSQNIPIIMVTSGGYQRRTADIIARSILNLYKKGLVTCVVQRQPVSHPAAAASDDS